MSSRTSTDPSTRRAGRGFAIRLMTAQALVLGAGGLTTWLVASAVGPGIFHEHLEEAGDTHTADEVGHIEEAFASALLFSVAVALLASVIAALAVSWYLSRRVQHSIANVTTAAADIASGRFHTRVPASGLGREFDALTDGYNSLAARLEAVETTRRRMLADLAHEMRTPLATIDAHLEAVEDGVRRLDDDTMGVLRTSTTRLRRLAEDMSAVSHAEEGNLEIHPHDTDPTLIARTAAAAATDRFTAKGVQLRTHLMPASTMRADPDRIGQVLTNLLDNALRHTPPGGTVTLTCEPGRRGNPKAPGHVTYVVADTGEGIPAKHLPHLFDRFYRVDTARDRGHGGSGIGLAITKAIVEAHGGTITAHSAGANTGATFTVEMPTQPDRR